MAQAPATPPRNIVVATKLAPPFVMKDDDGNWVGISIELWQHIAAALRLQTTFREYATVPEMLQATADGAADIAIAAITVTGERERMVDFTQPFFSTGLGIATPQRRQLEWLPIIEGFISLRFAQVVGILVGTAALVGVVLWLLERRHALHYRGGHRGLGTGLWWAVSAMMHAAPQDKAPVTFWGRAVATLWMVASVIVIAAFTAGITAQLTAKSLSGRVQSEFDLAHVRVGTVDKTSGLTYLRGQRIAARPYPSADSGLDALRKGELDAFVYDKPLLEYAAKHRYPDVIQVLPVVFDHQNYAIAVQPRSDLRTEIDLAMVDDLRTEWWREILTRYLGRQ
ncbi:MAG: transporter substrate-binding domain-containing protein [Acetobacteraceae bacterium]|nr:transporter substrate-binding domain-containing protein [Pseudomonadota bacterium]